MRRVCRRWKGIEARLGEDEDQGDTGGGRSAFEDVETGGGFEWKLGKWMKDMLVKGHDLHFWNGCKEEETSGGYMCGEVVGRR